MTASERFKAASASCTVPDGLCRECAIAAILAHAEAVREEDAIAVPTSWLDPLLSGPLRVVGDPPYESGQSVQDIERLLRSVQARIRAIPVT